MPRFQVDPKNILEGHVWLDRKESHHAISVLRLKSGDAVDLIDGMGHSFKGKIAAARDGHLGVRIQPLTVAQFSDSEHSLNSLQISVAVSVIKPERMELLIQKSCELGVSSIIPVRSERCIIKLSTERWQEKIKRWRKIATESCKQCGLTVIPQVTEVVDFRGLFSSVKNFDRVLIPTLAVTTVPLYEALIQSNFSKVLVLIGPEGDFTKKEAELAVTNGAVPVSLGPLVLRTETAAMYVLSALNFFHREIYRKGKADE